MGYLKITSDPFCSQGLCKFGLYEVFKVLYSDMLGEENYYVYRTWVYLAASASAEFFADIGLSPMESAKVSIRISRSSHETNQRKSILIFLLIYFSKGTNSDTTWIRPYPQRSHTDDLQSGRIERILQKFSSSLDASNTLHNDEIRLLRKNNRITLQVSIHAATHRCT